MTSYRLGHRPDLGDFPNAASAILAGIFAGLVGEQLDWIAVESDAIAIDCAPLVDQFANIDAILSVISGAAA